MKRLIVLLPCLLVGFSSMVQGQGKKVPSGDLLQRVEQHMRDRLPEVEKQLSFERPSSYPGTLIVNYQTRTFTVHGQTRIGKYNEKPHQATGPSYRGFRLRLHLQPAGDVNAAAVPQTIRGPYWQTYLDIRLLKGTNKQLYCGLSYGSRVDDKLLKQVREAINDLGDAPYLLDRP